MKFVLYEKSEEDLDLIVPLLKQEGMQYKIKSKDFVQASAGYTGFGFGISFCSSINDEYDVEVYTDTEHFEYVKYLIKEEQKKLKKKEKCLKKLEKCYKMNIKKEKEKSKTKKLDNSVVGGQRWIVNM